MINPTQEQSLNRYYTLPQELRDVIFSTETANIINAAAKDNHFSEEKTSKLAGVVGLVLLGFIHKDDLAKNIREELSVPPQTAGEVAAEIEKKIFLKYYEALKNIYNPKLPEEQHSAPQVDTIKKSSLSQTVDLSKPVALDNMPKAATMPSIASQGGSASAADIKFIPSVPPASFPSPTPAAPQPTPENATKKSPFVFTGSTSQVVGQPSAPAPKPAAFVTQTGSQAAPVGNVPKFKIETPGSLTGSAFAGSSTPTFSSAPRPAKIELGFSGEEKKQIPKPTTTFETQKSSIRYGAPIAPTFAQIPAEQKPSPAPQAPLPPTPPRAEPPKPLL